MFRATAVDVVTAPGLKVAYLPGTGDSVPFYLPNLGINAALLTPEDLTAEKLAGFDAVVLGVRAYSAHPDLDSAALKAYAAAGGVVVLQYMSGGFPAMRLRTAWRFRGIRRTMWWRKRSRCRCWCRTRRC